MVCISYGKCVKVIFVGFFIKGAGALGRRISCSFNRLKN